MLLLLDMIVTEIHCFKDRTITFTLPLSVHFMYFVHGKYGNQVTRLELNFIDYRVLITSDLVTCGFCVITSWKWVEAKFQN